MENATRRRCSGGIRGIETSKIVTILVLDLNIELFLEVEFCNALRDDTNKLESSIFGGFQFSVWGAVGVPARGDWFRLEEEVVEFSNFVSLT